MYSRGYYTHLRNFEATDVVFSNVSEHDRAMIFGTVSEGTLSEAGGLASHITDNGSAYIYGADAVATAEGLDEDTDLYSVPGEDGDTFDIQLKEL